MRTTLTLGDDVYRAAKNLADLKGIGLGEAVSDLVRRGLARKEAAYEADGLPVFSVSEKTPPFGLADLKAAEDEE